MKDNVTCIRPPFDFVNAAFDALKSRPSDINHYLHNQEILLMLILYRLEQINDALRAPSARSL